MTPRRRAGLPPCGGHRRLVAAGEGHSQRGRHDVVGVGEVVGVSPEPQYLSLYAKWDPGMVVRRHGHNSPHVLFVMEGEMWCGDRHCPAGTHVELPLGAAFGPFVAGPEGVVLFEVMTGDRDRGGTTRARSSGRWRRAAPVALPDPEIELPAWLEDLRSRWVVDDGP